ncbi:hypothetical protein AAE250_11885 [Bacteroides sp. GD17]|uniref:hypothetical protein n=1 Tax=Bacteroides sp. GD17 TaxID=3139826 RepID=UPI00313B348D
MKVTVEVPEGHTVKIVKDEESMQPAQKAAGGGKFEFEGETFVPGDVIINPKRGGGCMMILSEIREEKSLSFLPPVKYPLGYIKYIPSNDEGGRVFVESQPQAGIGGMEGFRKATEEEKAQMLSVVKEEKHFSFNFEKLEPEYIPTIGDVVILWDEGNRNDAVVGLLMGTDESDDPFQLNDGTWYNHCTKFISEQQFKDFINEEEQSPSGRGSCGESHSPSYCSSKWNELPRIS